jgi:hypothetical protein
MGNKGNQAIDNLAKQGIQFPVEVSTDWLSVGHIDEVFCFLSDNQVLVADPGLAWQEIINMVNDQSGVATTIRIGEDVYDEALKDVKTSENMFFDKIESCMAPINISDSWIKMADSGYAIGNYLLADEEVMKVTNVVQQAGYSEIWVERGVKDYGSQQADSHNTQTKIRRLRSEFVENIYQVSADRPVQEKISLLIEDLIEKLKLNGANVFQPVPVVFMKTYENGQFKGWVAASVNMVNSVVDGNTIYSSNPGCEQFRQLFINVAQPFTVKYPEQNSPDDKMAWEYHMKHGELHCGSNAKRTIQVGNPPKPWWEHQLYIDEKWEGTAQ